MTEEKAVPDDGFAHWSWKVNPIKSGIRTLTLLVTVQIKVRGVSDTSHDVPVFERDVEVLGGEHRRGNVIANAQYPGSLERVALDPWDEATDEKGFLTVDLERDEVVFHAIPGRPVVALAPIKVV